MRLPYGRYPLPVSKNRCQAVTAATRKQCARPSLDLRDGYLCCHNHQGVVPVSWVGEPIAYVYHATMKAALAGVRS
jgi:hypothetical protein